jgi:NADPH:quinone reductase-like Zn-dependent oxidoreductase
VPFRQTIFYEAFLQDYSKPRASIIGTDFTGEIAATGSAVQSFKVGDKVMGFSGAFSCGSHAQYFILRKRKQKK